jgi:hypothetical protein
MMTPEERQEFICAVREAANPAPQLTEEERQWVKLAIEAEGRKIRFRDAVIEKTVGGLLLMAVSGICYVFVDFAKNHGFK